MRKLIPLAALMAVTTMIPGGATAQGFGLSFGTNGRLALGFTDRVPGADVFLFGDATARLGFKSVPLGLELGVFGLADALDTPHETYGTLTWDFANGGRLSVGVPRPAYDGFAVSALENQFPSLGAARSGTTRSLATFGAMYANFLPYGISFTNETGQMRYAASVHTVPNQDTTIAGFGAAYPMGDWVLEGAIEAAWGKSTDVAGKIQVHGAAGPINGGVGLYLPGTVGGPEALEFFAAIDPIDRLTLGGVVQVPLDGTADPSAGVSARYEVRSGLDFSAGVLTDAGADAAFNAMIDFRF